MQQIQAPSFIQDLDGEERDKPGEEEKDFFLHSGTEARIICRISRTEFL